MKYPGKLLELVLIATSFYSALHCARAEEMAIVPLRPAGLLKCLPPLETGWRMTASNAQDIPDAWPRSKAVRQFVLEEPEPAGQGGAPAVLAKCQLTILDSGGHPGTRSLFAAGKQEGSAAASASFTVAGMPALRKDSPSGKQRVEVLAFDRFVLIAELEAAGEKPPLSDELSTPEKWLEKIDFRALREASKQTALLDVSKNHAMTVERIDEINPRRSSRSTWSFAVEIPSEN